MKYLIVDTFEDLEKACQYFSDKPVLGVDVETADDFEPASGRLRLIQISDGVKTVIVEVFHLIKNEKREKFSRKENFFLFEPLKKIFEDENIKFVAHNSKYEQKWLMYHCNIFPNRVFDTFIASQLIDYNDDNDPKRAHNLGAVGRRFLGVDLDKTEQKSDWSRWNLSKEQYDYAALDVYYLPELRKVQLAAIQADNQLATAILDFESIPCTAAAELKGIPVDVEEYTKQIEELEKLREKASETLQNVLRPTTGINLVQPKLFGIPDKYHGDVLLTSSSQMLEALKRLGVPVCGSKEVELIEKYESDGTLFAIGTNKKALSPLERDYPIIKLLQDFRGVEKMTSAFGRNILELIRYDENGVARLHPTFFTIGAITGRMSARNPNSMQIPDGEVEVGEDVYKLHFRKAFKFPKGRVGVIGDYSQIELRVAGEFSKDPVFIDAFVNGRDLHALTASLIYNLPYEDCTDPHHEYYKKYRAFAKRVNFGIVYGIGAWGLSALLKNTVEESEEILALHRQGHPVLWAYIDRQKYLAKKNLRAKTASGRLIRFDPPELDEYGKPDRRQLSSIARVGTNQPIQGTSVDILKIALALIHERLKGMDAAVINIVHDEIMIECEESLGEQVKEILETSMIEAGQRFMSVVPVEVEGKIISNWGEK